MARGFAIHNAPTDHGGFIPATQMRSSQMGNRFVCAGDGHYCPKCQCWSKVIKSHDHVLFDGKAVAYAGDKLTCGAKILPQQSHVVGDSQGSYYSAVSNFQSHTAQQQNESFLSEDNNFAIEIAKVLIKNDLFVPCGVPSYEGIPSNNKIGFEVKIKKGIFEDLVLEVEISSGKYFAIARISGPHSLGQKVKFEWDGFIKEIYDSKKFVSENGLNFRVKGYAYDKEQCNHIKNVKFKYQNKNWIDVLINKKTLNIDITLRVNIQDGGDFGLDTSWRRVPQSKIKSFNPPRQPLKQRSLSFNQIKNLAIQGMNYYWSRNNSHPTGKNISIHGQTYQVAVNSVDTTSEHMPSMPIIFASNWSPGRSCNWELSRKTYYNTGYIEFQTLFGNPNDSIWEYWDKLLADNIFKHTFAHEMGHEILLAYGGQLYSKKHKGSSSIFQSPIEGTQYPRAGEIDLMKYADENERNKNIKLFFERTIAAQEDVASLIFISGINLK